MQKNYRRFLFYVSVITFVFAGIFLITFAEGYKFDFFSLQFVKTGSLQLQTNVKAQIYINSKLVGGTSFFSDSFTGNRLMPQTYDLQIQNPEYEIWQKKAEIRAGLVTDFPRVVLVPKSLISKTIASSSFSSYSSASFDANDNSAVFISGRNIERFDLISGNKIIATPIPVPSIGILSKPSLTPYPSVKPSLSPMIGPVDEEIIPNAKTLVSPDGGKKVWFNNHEIWIEWLKDAAYQPYVSTGEVEFVVRYSDNIKDVQWFKDSAHLLVNAGNLLKFVETDTRGGINSYDVATVTTKFYYSQFLGAIYKFEGDKIVKINFNI